MAEYYNESETGRSLPETFKADLSSKTLSIICRVVIDVHFTTAEVSGGGGSPSEEWDEHIYLSTHKMNFDGNYYHPIIIENPKIKHSVGVEDRNFKISSVNFCKPPAIPSNL